MTVVGDVDGFLYHLRFGRARAESTTKTYTGHLKRFHAWCGEHDLSPEHAAAELSHYLTKLRTTPWLTSGRGRGQLPQDSTLAPALAAIHGFYLHLADLRRISAKAVDTGELQSAVDLAPEMLISEIAPPVHAPVTASNS
ncbi:site-specific integrase [Streptomyces sp. NBC_01571]|uniref:site-specific integrase n=1 Tax=Streptomyces sp. NBC_01571 TaxID=2975883 RepID=UPI0022560699|nr:site-specific integrase [Streptomyces sp. NBC_01571]MCX4580282.1 site-specific integrase [Streptomyces sp. NBC_01571]